MTRSSCLRWGLALLCLAMFNSCCFCPPVETRWNAPRIRFLLTFDDGPSIRKGVNPTLSIADQLATNDIQNGIHAMFFVQTRHPRGGGTPEGRAIMRQLHERGHVLGIHSVSPQGHVDHTTIPTTNLVPLLAEAKTLIRSLTDGADPAFVRPPYGVRNDRTRAIYRDLNLRLLLGDIRARDGVIYGYNMSLTRRVHMRHALAELRTKLAGTPAGAVLYPVIVCFHDVNPYTARHMTEYLHILVDEARREGLALDDKPFYGTREEIEAVGLRRSAPPPPR